MKVILIEEDRFAEIAAEMKAQALELGRDPTGTAERLGISPDAWHAACSEVHSTLHFYFVRWAQSHGASCVR